MGLHSDLQRGLPQSCWQPPVFVSSVSRFSGPSSGIGVIPVLVWPDTAYSVKNPAKLAGFVAGLWPGLSVATVFATLCRDRPWVLTRVAARDTQPSDLGRIGVCGCRLAGIHILCTGR
jgi:hypothetical protein